MGTLAAGASAAFTYQIELTSSYDVTLGVVRAVGMDGAVAYYLAVSLFFDHLHWQDV